MTAHHNLIGVRLRHNIDKHGVLSVNAHAAVLVAAVGDNGDDGRQRNPDAVVRRDIEREKVERVVIVLQPEPHHNLIAFLILIGKKTKAGSRAAFLYGTYDRRKVHMQVVKNPLVVLQDEPVLPSAFKPHFVNTLHTAQRRLHLLLHIRRQH